MCRFFLNPYRLERPLWEKEQIGFFSVDEATRFHRSLPGYKPTPLLTLTHLAQRLGLGQIYVKDEAHRFGLKAFKVLGASYAIYRFLKGQWGGNRGRPFSLDDFIGSSPAHRLSQAFTFCTATDGNHGRGVAWMARQAGQKAVIFMPQGTVAARIKNIEAEGARVVIVDGNYDDAVRQAAEQAARSGWQVISDTAYGDYREIPGHIMTGYLTLFEEIEQELQTSNQPAFDLALLQGGVGSLAAAAAWYYVSRYGAGRPRMVVVEPIEAACLLESAASPGGGMTTARGSFKTIMAGLNCGTPSTIAWPLLRDSVDGFLAISDRFAVEAMRRYYFPEETDSRIISGESGAAGLGGLLALMEPPLRGIAPHQLGINADTRVLLINTEGDTDPDNFGKIVGS